MGCLHPKHDADDTISTSKKAPALSADQWKEQGNSHFKSKNYALAIKSYTQAIVQSS